jgi:hypothetical protein
VKNKRGFHGLTRVRLWGIFDFGGKFGPPEADEVKKYAKMYIKKAKKNQKCAKIRTNIPGRTKKNANWGGLIPEGHDAKHTVLRRNGV